MLYFFRSVGKKVDIFCPWVPVAKYSLLLLGKKSSFLYIFSQCIVSIDILYNFFFFFWVVGWINKWVLIEIINTNRNKENVMRSLFLASTSWLESVCYLGTDYLTCRGGLWFFVSFRIFFSDNTIVRIFVFFVARSGKFVSRI